MITVTITLIIILFSYLIALFLIHDFKISSYSIRKFIKAYNPKKVLFIYPHPDDETFFSGGLANKLIKKNVEVMFVTVTKGEKGNELLKISSEELAEVRSIEYKKAVKNLGIKKYRILDFPDSKVNENYERLNYELREIINKENADMVVTYEPGGVYPHPDHIAVSKVLTELANDLKNFNLIYATVPQKMRKKMKLPKEIEIEGAKIPLEEVEFVEPDFRVPIFKSIFRKYKALLSYRSQNLNHAGPLWMQMFFTPFEYYVEGFKSNII